MIADVVRDLLARIGRLERHSVHYRQGVVTATSPLAVTLGGSATPCTAVQALVAGLAVGDVVSVLRFSNDLIVLGKIGGDKRIITGRVSGTGTVLAGSGFTAVRFPGFVTGAYSITFAPGFAAAPFAVASPVNTLMTRVSNHTPSAIACLFANGAGALTDTQFDFIAIGAP